MAEFKTFTGTCTPLQINNVDTDQIIPARYLLMITKTGYGDHLFQDWRYNEDGTPKAEFVLNQPQFEGSEILLAGENFGSGSSREHAVWAIQQFGFKVVIAPSFSDIFRNNAYGNGLLVISIPQEDSENIFMLVEKNPKYKLHIDLLNQVIQLEDGSTIAFEINPFVKEKIIKGLDNIGYILSKEDQIISYEQKTGKDQPISGTTI